MPTILIADDHPMCTAALAMASHAANPSASVDTAATLGEAETFARGGAYDLILLDLMLPDVQGFAGLALIRALRPQAPVAIVSSRDESSVVRQAMALGASGFIAKSSPIDRMVSAIRVMLEGGQWFPAGAVAEPAQDAAAAAAARIGTLSVAQLRVLRAIASGRQNKQIAFDLQLAEPTIKSHLAAIFRKLGVSNRTQAVLALQTVDPEDDAFG